MSDTVQFATLDAKALFAPVLPVVKSGAKDVVPAFSYTKVYVTETAVHALATDRFTLVESRTEVNNSSGIGFMYLPPAAVEVLAKHKGAEGAAYVTNGGKATVTLWSGQAWTFDVPNYPRLERVTESAWDHRVQSPKADVRLGVHVLDVLLKVVKAAGKGADCVSLHGTDKTDGPKGVEITDAVRMLVMPYRDRDPQRELFAAWPPLAATVAAATPADLAVAS